MKYSYRLNSEEFWNQIISVCHKENCFYSLVFNNKYEILSLNEKLKQIKILYQSKRTRKLKFEELYGIYNELYDRGDLPRNHFRITSNCQRVLGRSYSHAPGAALHALLPLLDDNIGVKEKGHLYIKE